MPIRIKAHLDSGDSFTFEIDAKDALTLIGMVEDLNEGDAAKYCGMDRRTFKKLGIQKNKNGRYSVEELAARKRSR